MLRLTKIKYLEKVGLESIFGDYKNSKYSWNECQAYDIINVIKIGIEIILSFNNSNHLMLEIYLLGKCKI